MENNFINNSTGEEFLVLNFRSRFVDGEMQYFDKSNKRLKDGKTYLTKIPYKGSEIGSPGIRTPTKNRL